MSVTSLHWVFQEFPILTFVLGVLVGSFLNVVIHRLPLDQSIVRPRSRCPHCEHSLAWFENIPLLSYLFLRGQCSHCKNKISILYPLVEMLTGLLFYFSWRGLGIDLAQLRLWVFLATGVAVFFIDLKHRIIPNELSLGVWGFGLLTAFYDFRYDWQSLWIASFISFGTFFLFAYLYEKVTGRVGIGGGDIKFMGTLGVFLGLGGVWSTLLISSILGSLVGIVYGKLTQQNKLLKATIPYGPFLVLGSWIELFFEVSKWMSP